jgi:hypothetical protein
MGCNCGNKGTSSVPKSFVVKNPDGSTKSYRTEVEARAAAQRTGGTWKPGS